MCCVSVNCSILATERIPNTCPWNVGIKGAESFTNGHRMHNLVKGHNYAVLLP